MSDPTKYEPKIETTSDARNRARRQQHVDWPQSHRVLAGASIPDPVVRFHRLPHGKGLPLPAYATAGAAGMDLYAAADVEIPPGGRALVGTGFAIEIPPGFEAQIRPRSGLAFHKGVTVLNSPGTIDSDYRGEVKVLLVNLSGGTYHCHWGYDRIAQLVIAPVSRLKIEEAEQLSETERGAGGFGSTGS